MNVKVLLYLHQKQKFRRSRVFVTFRHLTCPQRLRVDLGMPIACSHGELHTVFFREALTQSGAKRHPLCAGEGYEMACAGEG